MNHIQLVGAKISSTSTHSSLSLMSETAPPLPSQQSGSHPSHMKTVKTLSESPDLISIPSTYIIRPDPQEQVISSELVSLPVIDYSLLVSGTPDQRSNAIHDLGKACQDWGFFMVINHGVPDGLMRSIVDACKGFFDLTEEEKQQYEGKNVLDPIRCGTSFNASAEKVFCWKDFLKILVNPVFHSPTKPEMFREISLEYSKRVKEVARELLEGISKSLGLEENYIDKALDLEEGLQIIVANLYPPCPQPELAIGMPPHSDHGLLTLLIQNGIGGLQIQHQGKWVNVNAIPNSFLVNTGDHLEILTNGMYKSVLHRAVVNNKATRISIAMAHGPSLESVVSPSPHLLQNHSNRPAYTGMKYKDYLQFQQSNKLEGKTCLDRLRI